MKIIGLVCTALILSGCNSETTDKVQNTSEDRKSSETKEPVKNTPAVEISSEKAKTIKKELEQTNISLIKQKMTSKVQLKSIAINGEKFTTEDKIITKGSKVFNLLMSEYGRVKGSFVIVSKSLNKGELTKNSDFSSVTEIAKNTFRVYPLKQENLYPLYKNLSTASEFERVELEIDYSGEVTQAKSY